MHFCRVGLDVVETCRHGVCPLVALLLPVLARFRGSTFRDSFRRMVGRCLQILETRAFCNEDRGVHDLGDTVLGGAQGVGSLW